VRVLQLITAARLRRATTVFLALVPLAFVAFLWCSTPGASAQTVDPTNPLAPTTPATTPTTTPSDGRVSFDVDLGNLGDDHPTSGNGKPSKTIAILVGLTVLAIAPALVVLMTSFTRMVVVLGLARNAVGLQTVPPNQVITGLAVFLSLFVMAPTIKHINDDAWQPYLKGTISQSQALKKAETPIKTFMLKNTRREELDLMIKLSGSKAPSKPQKTSLTTLIPAFVLSELKAAFIIGVVVLLPFLVIDLVVSSGLMSLGMMMLPPVFVSLPFKLLLFVMVDGWSLIAHALVANYH
jgi:flagellar biosynthetic protein FliP